MTTPDDRAAFIAGLLDLARFLETHPAAPFPEYGTTIYLPVVHGTDEANIRVVDEAAAVLGTDAAWHDDSHYSVSRAFGPVGYEIGTITKAHMAAYRAEMSYRGCVRPDEAAA